MSKGSWRRPTNQRAFDENYCRMYPHRCEPPHDECAICGALIPSDKYESHLGQHDLSRMDDDGGPA